MKRTLRPTRRRLAVEPLESRALLTTGNPDGMWPLPNPGPNTSIFVRFAPNTPPIQQAVDLSPLAASVVKSFPDGPELITVGNGISPASAIRQLQALPGVVYASLDSTIHAEAVSGLPNDPANNQLWGLSNPNNVDIDAPEAWGVTLGNPSTIVAVVDTGIDLNNPDFAGKIWTNPNNDAAQGYPNDVHGWNFITNTPNVQDNDGHGTHVSAVIAAIPNNGYGVAGVDPLAQIMPLKFLDANGNGSTDNAVSAIYYAVQHGAKVINASWGGVESTQPLNDAIAFANAHNVVFVTAAGNDGTNNDLIPSYPSSFRQPNELSVAAVDRNGRLPSFSNFGPGTVDIAAPGVSIVSDVPTFIDPSGLQILSGTSMSTAYVSGVAALVAGMNPSLTASQIVQRIDATAKPLSSLAGKVISGGIVDAYNAVAGIAISASGTSTVAGVPSFSAGSATEAQVQGAILASDEYFANHGGIDTGFITGLYQNVLGRNPDPAGLQQWVSVFDSDTTTRYGIALAFLTSTEGRLTEVARWFQGNLGRTASIDTLKADPGLAGWASQLLSGVGDHSVQASIMTSPEYLNNHGRTSAGVVRGFYQDLTARRPSASETNRLANRLNHHASPFSVLRSFQGASEVAGTLIAHWYLEDLGRAGTIAQLKSDPGVKGLASLLGNY